MRLLARARFFISRGYLYAANKTHYNRGTLICLMDSYLLSISGTSLICELVVVVVVRTRKEIDICINIFFSSQSLIATINHDCSIVNVGTRFSLRKISKPSACTVCATVSSNSHLTVHGSEKSAKKMPFFLPIKAHILGTKSLSL